MEEKKRPEDSQRLKAKVILMILTIYSTVDPVVTFIRVEVIVTSEDRSLLCGSPEVTTGNKLWTRIFTGILKLSCSLNMILMLMGFFLLLFDFIPPRESF